MLPGVADAPVVLDHRADRGPGGVRGLALRDRGGELLVGGVDVEGVGGVRGGVLGHRDRDVQVGQVVLDRLEGPDRLAELQADLVVLHRVGERLAGDAGQVAGHQHGGPVQHLLEHHGGGVLQPLGGGAVEHDACQLGRAVQRVLRRHRDTRTLGVDQVQTAVAARDDQGVGDLGVLDQAQVTGEAVAADLDGRARRVRRGPVAHQGDRAHDQAFGEARQVLGLLSRRAGEPYGLTDQDRGQPRARHGRGAEGPGDDGRVEQAQAQSVVLLGHEHGQPALLVDGLPQVGRDAVGVVVEQRADLRRPEAVAQVGADRVLEGALLVGELEVHGRDSPGSSGTRD